MLGAAGLLGGIFTKNFSKDNRLTIMLMVATSTIVCETIVYIVQIINGSLLIEIIPFIKIILVETIYNIMLTIIIYPIIKHLGNQVEKIFTEDNILTRYY